MNYETRHGRYQQLCSVSDPVVVASFNVINVDLNAIEGNETLPCCMDSSWFCLGFYFLVHLSGQHFWWVDVFFFFLIKACENGMFTSHEYEKLWHILDMENICNCVSYVIFVIEHLETEKKQIMHVQCLKSFTLCFFL